MSLRLMLIVGLFCAGLSLHAQPSRAQEADAQPAADSKSIGYFLGLSVGQQMSQSGFQLSDIDLDSLKAGFSDGLSKKESAMPDEQLGKTQQTIQTLLGKRRTELVAQKKVEGAKWLEANAKKEGVKSLENGLQYKVLASGKGVSPKSTDKVRVHYTGKLTNGEVFDSSVRRGEPAEFGVGQVIPGWTMALQKMKVGDKWMLYIPSDLGYGERGGPGGSIGPNEVLVFEVELLGIL